MANELKTSKTDIPLEKATELGDGISWEDYNLKHEFKYVCKIKPKKEEEKVEILDPKENRMKKPCAYVMIVNKKIFKFGATSTGIQKRIGSYNAGTKINRESGKCSVTNYWVLQSIINIGLEVEIYAIFPEKHNVRVLGKKFEEPFPSAKTFEKRVIRLFEKKYGAKPIGNTQG